MFDVESEGVHGGDGIIEAYQKVTIDKKIK